MHRRRFVINSALALAAAGTSSLAPGAGPLAAAQPARGNPDVWLKLTASRRRRSILPGPTTEVWSFTGKAKRGGSNVLESIPGSYLGPTIRVRRGQRVRIDFRNRLPQDSIVHLHGLHVPESADGHPRFAVPRGGKYRYEFDVTNPAGTYWYHPHPHGRTGEQVYRGLAGLLIVEDDEADGLDLPSGSRDVSLVLQDRHFDDDNQLDYSGFGRPDPGQLRGFLGSQILVNGAPHPTLEVTAAPYRLRLLNGSNSRIYKLGWNDRSPLTVIATDGGLLRRPVRRNFVTLAPGERVEVWVDFADWGVDTTLELRTLGFDPGFTGMGPGGANEMPMGTQVDLLTVRVASAGDPGPGLPANLADFERYRLGDAVNSDTPRTFEFAGGFGTWTINGRTFEMLSTEPDERVQLGTLETWTFENAGRGGPGGMMMRMPHPVHAHGQAFQVVRREVASGHGNAWSTVVDGYVDGGWKDTVLLMPGERVQVLKRFDDHAGLFLLHCHNLEHEDAGMMRNFLIE